MKKCNASRFDTAVVVTLAMISLFAAFSWGQTPQQGDPRLDTATPAGIGDRATTPPFAAEAVPAGISAGETTQANARRISSRASDRKTTALSGKNRRTPSAITESGTSDAAKGPDAVPEPADKSAPLFPIVPSGDPVTGGALSVPPALADTSGAAPPTGTNASTNPENTVTTRSPEPPHAEQVETVPSGPDFSLFKAAGGFGLVLSLIALGYFGARKYFPQRFVRGGLERNLKLVETLSIGEKRSVAVIEFDNQRYIVGNTPNQITLLAALPAKVAPAEEARPASTPPFELSKTRITSDTFRNLYEVEKTNGVGNRRPLPPDIRAKMRQLRESLET